jgi:hypothetical protein
VDRLFWIVARRFWSGWKRSLTPRIHGELLMLGFAPQVWFSATMRKIRSRMCLEIRFLPTGLLTREIHRQ